MGKGYYYTTESDAVVENRLGKSKPNVANIPKHINMMIQANNQLNMSVVNTARNELLIKDIDELRRWANSLVITCDKYKSSLTFQVDRSQNFQIEMVSKLPYDMVWYINKFLNYRADIIIGKELAKKCLWGKVATMKEQYIKCFFYYSVLPNLEPINPRERWGRWDKEYFMKKFFGLCKKDALDMINDILNLKSIKIKAGYMKDIKMKICYKKFLDRADYVFQTCCNYSGTMDKQIKENFKKQQKRLNDHINTYANTFNNTPTYVW